MRRALVSICPDVEVTTLPPGTCANDVEGEVEAWTSSLTVSLTGPVGLSGIRWVCSGGES